MGLFDGKSLGQSLSALLDREKAMILRGVRPLPTCAAARRATMTCLRPPRAAFRR